MAAILAVFWVPATSLCLLEDAGWVANEDCCSHASGKLPANDSSETSLCCALTSATYKIDDNRPVTAPSIADAPAVLIDLTELEFPPSQLGCVESDASCAGLAKNWQFALRAASSPRAPSLAS